MHLLLRLIYAVLLFSALAVSYPPSDLYDWEDDFDMHSRALSHLRRRSAEQYYSRELWSQPAYLAMQRRGLTDRIQQLLAVNEGAPAQGPSTKGKITSGPSRHASASQPSIASRSSTPGTSEAADAPATPGTSETPNTPGNPGTPGTPGTTPTPKPADSHKHPEPSKSPKGLKPAMQPKKGPKPASTKPLSQHDKMIEFLSKEKHITWKPVHGGNATIIPSSKWNMARKHVLEKHPEVKNKTTHQKLKQPLKLKIGKPLKGKDKAKGKGKTKQAPPNPKDLKLSTPAKLASVHRRQSGRAGGYKVGRVDCYGSGSPSQVAQILSFLPDACSALNGMKPPDDDQAALLVWNSPQVPNVLGVVSYIRFSTQWLTPGNMGSNLNDNPQVCQAALAKFDVLCQDGDTGATQGGELWVGESTKFSADPTDMNCNC